MKASIKTIETLVNEINKTLENTGFKAEDAFKTLCLQIEKFDNVFFQFSDEDMETQDIYQGFDFSIDDEFETEFTILQMYSDINKLCLEY